MNKKSRKKKARLAAVAVLMMTIMFSSQQVSAKEEIQVREEGLKPIIQGVAISQNTQKAVKRIGTSFEVVLVGQRMGKREIQSRLDFGNQGAEEVKRLKEKSIGFTENKLVMSDEDYNTLLKIVEAEAGGEDIKGKILVANVIFNRMKSPDFPSRKSPVFSYGRRQNSYGHRFRGNERGSKSGNRRRRLFQGRIVLYGRSLC